VVTTVVDKMVRRHPHVFTKEQSLSYDHAMEQWESIKQGEGRRDHTSVLNEVPRAMPALLLAYRIQEKAAAVGFDWPAIEPVALKVEEEARELREAMASGDTARSREELGDLLFACVNLARFMETDPERLLRATIDKFRERFRYIEESLAREGRRPGDATLEEMDRLWEEAKKPPAGSAGP
jgi:tetrapyrrole methylase family protein/MazG family protein